MKSRFFFFLLLSATARAAGPDPCSELPVGGVRVNADSTGASATGLAYRQEVERTGERSFKLRFYLRFVPDWNYAGPTGTMNAPVDVDATYQNLVNQCLRDFNPLLAANDDNKQKWNVELEVKPAPPPEGLPLSTIRIGGKGFDPRFRWKTKDLQRASSLVYPADISCQTIVHELLHLGGLVDEYDENSDLRNDIYLENGHPPAFSCRVLGPRTSVMNNEYLALGPTVKFGMQPAHIRALTYPGCQEKNARYYKCAKQAYSAGDCNTPIDCTLESGWLR